MNGEQLRKRIGQPHRLRPLPRRFAQDSRELPPRDDQWVLEQVAKGFVKLSNASTGHVFKLGSDNLHEFRTPDFLLLRCQIIIFGNHVRIEPLIYPELRRAKP